MRDLCRLLPEWSGTGRPRRLPPSAVGHRGFAAGRSAGDSDRLDQRTAGPVPRRHRRPRDRAAVGSGIVSRPPVNIVLVGDALEQLRTLPSDSVDCVITSPPYFRLRNYGAEGQYGHETTIF